MKSGLNWISRSDCQISVPPRLQLVPEIVESLAFLGAGNPLARRLHKCFAVATEGWGDAELLRRARGTRKFLETNESGSRLSGWMSARERTE
jgi:hypothetical protein